MCSSQFVYLRDNKLANLAGIEILKRVKVDVDDNLEISKRMYFLTTMIV